jgi:IBR domain, a half RING-finger domain
MTSECPCCWLDFPAEELVGLGPCSHKSCRPCGLQIALAGLSYDVSHPRCEICYETPEELQCSATKYGVGWLSFEALSTLHHWSQSSDGKAALQAAGMAGGISEHMLDRYSRKMILAALAPREEQQGLGLLARRSTRAEMERQARARARAERDFANDDGEMMFERDDEGTGVTEDDDDSDEGGAAPSAPSRPPLLRAASSTVGFECPNPTCHTVLSVPGSIAAGKKAVRDSCHSCKTQLCISCGQPWLSDTGRSHFGMACEEYKVMLQHVKTSEATANAFIATLSEDMKRTVGKVSNI